MVSIHLNLNTGHLFNPFSLTHLPYSLSKKYREIMEEFDMFALRFLSCIIGFSSFILTFIIIYIHLPMIKTNVIPLLKSIPLSTWTSGIYYATIIMWFLQING